MRLQTIQERLRTEGLPLLPAGLAIAVVIAWAATGGGYESQPALDAGYDPGPWYFGALAMVGLPCATVFGMRSVRLSLASKIACSAFGGYVAWSFLSVLWAHDQGSAFLGSDHALVYFAAFVLFAILPWRGWSAQVALAALIGGIGVLAVVTAIRVAVLSDPSSLYLDGRLTYPLGYYNADAAMFMTAAVAAIALCSRRAAPAPLRISGLVVAAVCLQLALLGQSRGWLFTAPIVLIFALLLVPRRLRLLASALGPAAATAVTAPALLNVYGKATVAGTPLSEPRLGEVLHRQGSHAARAMLIADVVLALVTALAVTADRRTELTQTAERRLKLVGGTLVAGALLAGIAAGLLVTHGHPIERMEHAWSSFADARTTPGGSSRFASLGSQRVDMWRVALHEFSRHPLSGMGQDNFAAGYLRLRHAEQEPRWVHSIELRMLAHTGLVGALLFALSLGATLVAALGGRQRREAHRSDRVAAGILLLPLTVWLVHGSVDWLWELPALSVPALAFAGAAAALARPHAQAQRSSPSRKPLAFAGWLSVALLGASALIALAIPFTAARKIQTATKGWQTHPALAYSQLRSASDLMPFDAQIDLLGGSIALNLGEYEEAGRWLATAERRDDQSWLAPFALGLAQSELGHRIQARAQLRLARRLNPRETVITQALDRIHSHHPLTFAEAQLMLSSRAQARFGR